MFGVVVGHGFRLSPVGRATSGNWERQCFHEGSGLNQRDVIPQAKQMYALLWVRRLRIHAGLSKLTTVQQQGGWSRAHRILKVYGSAVGWLSTDVTSHNIIYIIYIIYKWDGLLNCVQSDALYVNLTVWTTPILWRLSPSGSTQRHFTSLTDHYSSIRHFWMLSTCKLYLNCLIPCNGLTLKTKFKKE